MLEHEDIERLREIFVTRQECDGTVDEINRKMSNSEVKTAVIETKLNQIMSGQNRIAAGVVTLIVGLITLAVKIFVGG